MRGSKYPYDCVCGEFLLNKFKASRHYKECEMKYAIKSNNVIKNDIMYCEANLKLDALENDFKKLWLCRFPDSDKFK